MDKTHLKRKGLSLLMHLLAWLLLIILPQLIINRFWGSNNHIAWGFYLGATMYGIIFYINYLWLVPQFYLRQKEVVYVISAAVVIAVLYFFFIMINEHFFQKCQFRIQFFFFEFFLAFFAGTVLLNHA